MRGLAVLLLVLAALPGAAAHPFLVGVAPDLPGPGPGDDGFAIGADVDADVSGYRVTDGEGTWIVPAGTHLVAGQPLWVVGDLPTWQHFQGPGPSVQLKDGRLEGDLVLANAGDSLTLLAPDGAPIDSFAWGDKTTAGTSGSVTYTSSGLVYLRDHDIDGWIDTNDRSDWITPRMHRIGESHLDQPTFTADQLTLYSSPDSSFHVLSGLIANATQRLHLHVYELRSAALTDLLVAARTARPTLDLQVFLDDNPVGQTSPERHATADALRRIQAAGGNVTLGGSGRYDDFHLKVLVADDSVAVQSENWVDSGVPQDPTLGNRGWGTVVHSPAMAAWFANWLAADRHAWDAKSFDLATFDPLFAPPDRAAPAAGAYAPVVPETVLSGTFEVTPWVAPDHTQDPRDDPLARLIGSARSRVDVEELDLATGAANSLGWRSDDPLLKALEAAAERGVTVRVLAAPPFSAADAGNAAALAALSSHHAVAAELARPGITTLHNKGLIVDDAVVVGSMNGNHHSRSANREVDLLLRGPGVADAYERLFASDLAPPAPPADVGAIGRDLHGLPPAPLPTLFVVLAVGALLRSRP